MINQLSTPSSLFAIAVLCLSSAAAKAEQLLTGTVNTAAAEPVAFALSGESREDVVGGDITFGDKSFAIEKVSVRGLVGASRRMDQTEQPASSFAEYAIFSSSYSEQTAVGQPWVAAKRYLNCDTAYNSFLAIYRIEGPQAIEALGAIPYPTLTEDAGSATDSTVYCFMSMPPT